MRVLLVVAGLRRTMGMVEGRSANVPFVRAIHVAFEVTNYQPAICVPTTYALCITAKTNQKVTTTLFAHVLSAKHASFSVT